MTKQELLKDVKDEITFSGALPYAIPDKEINRIIDISSEYFYDNWRHALEPRYLLIPGKVFRTDNFKRFRQIQMPECIRFVHQVNEPKGASIFATIDRDFSEQKFIGSEVYLTPFIGESIMYRTIIFSFLDLTRGLILDTIAYDYNKNSRLLTIVGRTPLRNAVVKVAKKIEEEHLYEDELYKRYVRAKARIKLGELLQTFDYTLPGGVKINYSITVEKAEKELEKVEAQMRSENTPDWMLLYRQ